MMKRLALFLSFPILIFAASPALADEYDDLGDLCQLAVAQIIAFDATGLSADDIFHKKAKPDRGHWHIWFVDEHTSATSPGPGQLKITIDEFCDVVPDPPCTAATCTSPTIPNVDAAIASAIMAAGLSASEEASARLQSAKLRKKGGDLLYEVKMLYLAGGAGAVTQLKEKIIVASPSP